MSYGSRMALGAVGLWLTACGGSGGGGGTSGTCTPGPSATIAIAATGISPTNVCVQPGGTVTFRNDDAAATHDIEFETAGCPAVGDVSPGTQVSASFPTTRNCTFHDGRNASSTAFRGTVAVTSTMVSGGGY